MARKQLKDSDGNSFYPNTDLEGSDVKYTGTTGNVVTNNTTLNVAIKAIDDAIGDIETLLANI